MAGRILIVDDEPRVGLALQRALARAGFDAEFAREPLRALTRLKERAYDVLLTDFMMPELDGIELLRRTKAIQPACEVVVVTAHATVSLARQALTRGAVDFLTKPFSPERELIPLLERILASAAEVEAEAPAWTPRAAEGDPVGSSAVMRALVEKARKLAASNATALLRGESGTGKEVVAALIHRRSRRALRPFVTVNCAALPATLLESELFGHRRGAFTGADADRKGLFQAADGGTIFLDEIAEIPLELQPKLLRVLQDGEFHRIGDPRGIRVDVRVIAATNRDLEESVRSRSFRGDLYYRLNVVPLRLPPLRERREDLPELTAHFVARLGKDREVEIDREALEVMMAYDWPGNVRELANAVEHALVLGDGLRIRLEDLPLALQQQRLAAEVRAPEPSVGGRTLEEIEIRCILQALERTRGHRTRAARLLGITRRTLGYRIQKYGLEAEAAAAGEADPPEPSRVL